MEDKKPTSKDEKRIIGASYIYDFYILINQLTDLNAQYYNTMLETEEKGEIADDLDKDIIRKLAQQIRYVANRVYVMYKTLIRVLKELQINSELDKEIETKYHIIKTVYIFPRENLEELVIAYNAVIIQDVIKKLLTDNESIVNELFANE